MKWGWHNNAFIGVYERLQKSIVCYREMSSNNVDFFNAINNLQVIQKLQIKLF